MTAPDQYRVLGHPVEHSKSPLIHARFAELTGQAIAYDRLLVPLDGFDATVDFLRATGVKGCNVTLPFKVEAFEYARRHGRVSARAELAQACNLLDFADGSVLADNTDGIGLVHDLQNNADCALAGRDVLLIGAGGAAAGCLAPFIEAAPRRIVVANRSPDKAQALAERHAALAREHGVELAAHGLHDVPGTFQVVVNASASSIAGIAAPVAGSVLAPQALVVDLMYGPASQGFLDWGRGHGARTRDGLGMLVEQAAEAFVQWRGVRPDSARVLAKMQAALQNPRG
ncbi:MAG: Shikimate dehydrogenase (NADP(+)) [Paracidovorax wautersii]|uniref:Shikimate dehydrogenase (NADP(+)) n=1 Tax=Paracidovorax wautersii TaxID=1177982 RepID=A0A7V8JSA6_9BURK|nr:MAG: Shikimate dehydrogenase (NADP(+)) [Paracidovorax wautersii]